MEPPHRSLKPLGLNGWGDSGSKAAGAGTSKWRYLLPEIHGPLSEIRLTDRGSIKNSITIPKGSLLQARHSGQSLRAGEKDKREVARRRKSGAPPRMPKRIRDGLWVILTRDLGLSRKIASALCRLPLNEYRRIEEAIEGVVDSLFCADPSVFTEGEDLKTIKTLVRKIFSVGAFNRPILVDQWKQWTNWFKHTCAGTILIGGSAPLDTHNLFRRLNNLSIVAEILSASKRGRFTREQLAVIGHLTSTRQMPYMGKAVEEAALAEFCRVITSEPPDWKPLRPQIERAVRDIARTCKASRGDTPINDGTAHISVTSSGEWDGPVRKGGQAYTLSEVLKTELTKVVPAGDEETPFGVIHHPGDAELWKYLFREDYRFDYEFLKDKEFMAEWKGGKIPHTVEGYFYGLDGALGQQILYLAWKAALAADYPTRAPEIRASTVAETGNKARIVTVSHWWLNILESPVAHWMVELLRFHPSCFSAFQRQDQAWSFATQCVPPRREKLYGGETAYACLSSDLKNATNAIPLDLMRFMWRVFIEEWGYSISPYLDFVLSLISERWVKFPEGSLILATRGLPMGEALAKPSLTLWALTAERMAFNRFMDEHKLFQVAGNRPDTFAWVLGRLRRWTFPLGEDIAEGVRAAYHTKSWHYFHLGGDDHVAYGPKRYLDAITESFRSLGAMLSPGKHGYSHTFIQYCERILDIHRTDHVQIVDTMKVRLLCTGQSTGITRDQKNVAIGKAAQFSNYIGWAGEVDGWTEGKKVALQALWMSRMGKFLPGPSSPYFFSVLLPQALGGYGLGFPSQWEEALASTDPIFTKLVNYLLTEPPGEEAQPVISMFGAMVRNPTSRGIAEVGDLEREIAETITLYPSQYDAKTWKEVRSDERFADPDNKRVVAKAAAHGVISSSEYAKRVTRGSLFRTLIMDPEKAKPFNTRPYVEAVEALKVKVEESNLPGCEKLRTMPPGPTWWPGTLRLKRVLDGLQPSYFIDSTAPMTFVTGAREKFDGEWVPLDWIFEEFPRVIPQRLSGRPDMVLGLEFCGLGS